MLFNTWEFAVFFGMVFGVYHLVDTRAQNVLLLIASYFFLGWFDWRFPGLLLLTTALNYGAALWVERTGPVGRRRLVAAAVAANLGILAVFKYLDFFIGSMAALAGALGLDAHPVALGIILPVGISFYTFQALGYVVDVHRDRVAAVRDPVLMGVFISYFPQLVAGPIERASNLLPRLASPRRVDAQMLASGALLVLVGLVRKVAIADVAAPLVDEFWASPAAHTSLEALAAVVLFTLQIYCDFAGYTDMARGLSRMLGIELMVNFRTPYFSRSVAEFWRRWHISLSTWLRDYLYIPLGGSRAAPWKTHRNLLATMLLCGLWHGAAWTFVAWGGLHGLALSAHRLWRGRGGLAVAEAEPGRGVVRAAAAWALTMTVVMAGWVLFRSPSWLSAAQVYEALLWWRGPLEIGPLLAPAALAALMLFLDLPARLTDDEAVWLRWPWPVRGVVYAGLVLLMLMIRQDNVPFIYFQF